MKLEEMVECLAHSLKALYPEPIQNVSGNSRKFAKLQGESTW